MQVVITNNDFTHLHFAFTIQDKKSYNLNQTIRIIIDTLEGTKLTEKCSQKLTQSQIFLDYEGDRWFKRNQPSENGESKFYEIETIKRALRGERQSINNVLEIGCGNGVKLNDLCQFFNANGCGVDPSSAAITNGNQAHSNLNLTVATASSLPYVNNFFDLVYFGFCLYLVDREDVYKAVAEADRVLKSGGYLAILDFDPKHRHKRPYHHAPGLFSYKTSYSDFFTAAGHYYLVAKDSFSHGETYFSKDSDERISICILYKEPDPY